MSDSLHNRCKSIARLSTDANNLCWYLTTLDRDVALKMVLDAERYKQLNKCTITQALRVVVRNCKAWREV